jgi:uncharacterized membrane protein YcjF (UPF0283 family)
MKTRHVSEEILQQYAINALTDADIIAHITSCKSCKQQAAVYQAIFSGIKERPKPAFEFDLAETVLAKMPDKQPVRAYLWDYLLGSCAILLLAVPAYTYRKILMDVFKNAQSVVISTVLMVAVVIIGLQVVELSNKYRKQSKLLNSAQSLQH